MLIGDGVTPGNEGRGYVLRRLLRRAVRSMRLLGYEDPALPELMPISRDKMGETYTDLVRDWDRIARVAYGEEDTFRKTLQAGTQIFDLAASRREEGRRDHAGRRAGLRPARHLRLPDRPDPGDGGRAGPRRRRAGLPRPDGRAARPGQGRRAGRRRASTPTPRSTAASSTPTARPSGWPTRRSRPSRGRWRCSPPAAPRRSSARARSASSCSTARRSTPSPAARPPTRVSSTSTAAASRCSTSSARSRAWSCTRCASPRAS